jgi:DNA-binding LacI/PurR family transcriptional regulator
MAKALGPREGQKVEDIVVASGVSRSTVFRYFAGKPVRPAAASAIERAVATLSKPLETRAEGRRDILVSLPPSYTGFRGYAEILEGLVQRAREIGAAVVIDSRRAQLSPPGGVILIGKQARDEDAEYEAWKSRLVPCVFVNRIFEDAERSWVSVDCREAGREAVAHLIGQGCKRIAAWSDELSRVSRDKLRGYRDALAAAGLPDSPELVLSPADMGLEEAFDALMGLPDPPDGWFSTDDDIALRVMALAADRGLSVPRDLAVVGMNDISSAPQLVSSLSSVRLPFREMGSAAVDALERLIEHPMETSVRILLAHDLAIRGSSSRKEIGE